MRRGLVVACVSALAMAGCGSDTQEPVASRTESPHAEQETSSPMPDDAASEDQQPDDEQSQPPPARETFAQPFLQKENIVELRDEVPIEIPDDATTEEVEVVRAYGRYYAAWEQVLWGVPVEDSGIENTAAGERLESVRAYAQESLERERVSVGPPVAIHLLSVEVTEDSAVLGACIDSRNWVDSSSDQPPEPDDPMYHFSVTLDRTDGQWLVTNAEIDENLEPCEGVFE